VELRRSEYRFLFTAAPLLLLALIFRQAPAITMAKAGEGLELYWRHLGLGLGLLQRQQPLSVDAWITA
jgi:hypothetical protein